MSVERMLTQAVQTDSNERQSPRQYKPDTQDEVRSAADTAPASGVGAAAMVGAGVGVGVGSRGDSQDGEEAHEMSGGFA
jgi:hypothetical protein